MEQVKYIEFQMNISIFSINHLSFQISNKVCPKILLETYKYIVGVADDCTSMKLTVLLNKFSL